MSNNIVTLLLGTNLGDKNNNLELAKSLINKEVGDILKYSNILENEAVGFTSSNSFLNQKIEVYTTLSQIKVLKTVKSIENLMGRTYTQPLEGENYVDRIIDIDVLLFNNISFFSSGLIIPHHQVVTREFVKELFFI